MAVCPDPRAGGPVRDRWRAAAAYVKALDKRAGEILTKAERLGAKGLLIAVDIKAKGSVRVWSEAVDGDVPANLLRLLEMELADVKSVDLKQAPTGFAMEVNLLGRNPGTYPEFPKVWVEAAKKAPVVPLAPPDARFDRIWPDRE